MKSEDVKKKKGGLADANFSRHKDPLIHTIFP